jgi:hypothetical protein
VGIALGPAHHHPDQARRLHAAGWFRRTDRRHNHQRHGPGRPLHRQLAHYGSRPAASGDVQQDVHAAPNNGDTAAYIFNGTGVAYVTERSADEGQVDIYLDSVFQQTVDAGPGAPQPGRTGVVQQDWPAERPTRSDHGQEERHLDAAGCNHGSALSQTYTALTSQLRDASREPGAAGHLAFGHRRATTFSPRQRRSALARPDFGSLLSTGSASWPISPPAVHRVWHRGPIPPPAAHRVGIVDIQLELPGVDLFRA